jgi:hypothetical protein
MWQEPQNPRLPVVTCVVALPARLPFTGGVQSGHTSSNEIYNAKQHMLPYCSAHNCWYTDNTADAKNSVSSFSILHTCHGPPPALIACSIRLWVFCMQGHQQCCSWRCLLLQLLPCGVELQQQSGVLACRRWPAGQQTSRCMRSNTMEKNNQVCYTDWL